jgi:hypothetical protein
LHLANASIPDGGKSCTLRLDLIQDEPKNRTFAFFGEKFSKITYKGYLHANFEKFSQKNAKVRFF